MKKSFAIKRHQALVSFSKDHHFGLLLVWKIRQGIRLSIEPGRISNYVIFFFENDLARHFKEEEEKLFPKLSADDPLRQQAYREHEKIYSLVHHIQKDKLDIHLLKELADSLEGHIRFEERVLFNHLQHTLSDDELVALSDDHGKPEGDIDNKWSDHFWISK